MGYNRSQQLSVPVCSTGTRIAVKGQGSSRLGRWPRYRADRQEEKRTRGRLFSQLWPGYHIPNDAGGFLPGLILFGSSSRGSVCIADMQLPGAPLIYVNEHFCRMTGFSAAEVLGRSCRFLQGPGTEP